jgi:hypothetical protein
VRLQDSNVADVRSQDSQHVDDVNLFPDLDVAAARFRDRRIGDVNLFPDSDVAAASFQDLNVDVVSVKLGFGWKIHAAMNVSYENELYLFQAEVRGLQCFAIVVASDQDPEHSGKFLVTVAQLVVAEPTENCD